MSLSALNWKQLPVQSGMTALVPNVIDAINTAFKSNIYIDGSARVTGSDIAWTPTIEKFSTTTEACYFTPPSSSLGQKIIVAGSSRTGLTPTMGSPDTYAANFLHVSLSKNVGTGSYSSWTNASPFSAGNFFGYWKIWSTSMGGALSIRCFESTDAIAIFIHCASDTITGFVAGGIIDCETNNTSSDSETDNKVYGIITTGANTTSGKFSLTSNNLSTNPTFGFHGAATANAHAGIFNPNQATVALIQKVNYLAVSDSTTLFTKSANLVKLPIFVNYNTTPLNFVGRLREIWYFRDAVFGNSVTDGSTVNGYLISGGTTSVADTIMLST